MKKEIKINVEIAEKSSLFMTQYVGEATHPDTGEKIQLEVLMNMAPMVTLPTGEKVLFDWQSLINAAYHAVQETEVTTND